MKNYLNLNRNRLRTISVFTLLLFGAMGMQAQAQLTTAFNLRPIFTNSSNIAELLFKYEVGSNMAVRFKINGYQYNNKSNQNFYEDDMYANLDKWPSDMSMDGYSNTGTSLGLAPGFELRTSINEKTLFYYGIDLGVNLSTGKYENNWHSAYKDPNSGKYVIQQIRNNNSNSKTTTFTPAPLIGIQRSIASGFSVLFETSVSASFSRSTGENDNTIYTWNAGNQEFELPTNVPDEFKEQAQPWNTTFNWSPSFNLFVAYTFGS